VNLPDAEFFNDPELIYMTSVIGRFPECIAAAAKFNLNTLVTSERIWRFTNVSGDPGAMSRAFWRQTARANHGILLASNPALASGISLYWADLKFLKELGYKIVFKDQSARVVSNEKFPKAFGNAIVIISTNSLNLRIIRDRDEFWFDIAPAHVPNEWRPLQVVLGYVKDSGNGHLPSCISLRHVGALLESRLDLINEALSPEKFAATKVAVDEAEATILKAWVREFSN
jgi:hypothetical protein